jgi:hypothetical protein
VTEPPTLQEFGEALWGRHWRAPMALALGVNHRTVERWAKGDGADEDTMRRLAYLLQARHAQTAELLSRCGL